MVPTKLTQRKREELLASQVDHAGGTFYLRKTEGVNASTSERSYENPPSDQRRDLCSFCSGVPPSLVLSTPLNQHLGGGTSIQDIQLTSDGTALYVCGLHLEGGKERFVVAKLTVDPETGSVDSLVWSNTLTSDHSAPDDDRVAGCALGNDSPNPALYLVGETYDDSLVDADTDCAAQARSYSPDVVFARFDGVSGDITYLTYISGSRGDKAFATIVQPSEAYDGLLNGDVVYVAGSTSSDDLCGVQDNSILGDESRYAFLTRIVFNSLDLSAPLEKETSYIKLPSFNPYVPASIKAKKMFFRNPTELWIPMSTYFFQLLVPYPFDVSIVDVPVGSAMPGDIFRQYIQPYGETSEVEIVSVAVDSQDNVILAGLKPTSRTEGEFPVVNALQDSRSISTSQVGDIYYAAATVTKFDPTLAEITFSTFLGGSYPDWPMSLAIGVYDEVIVSGHTRSTDFPTTEDAIVSGLGRSLFVAIISPFGDTLEYSTQLGGYHASGGAMQVQVTNQARIYVAADMARHDDDPNFPLIQNIEEQSYAYQGIAWLGRLDFIPAGLPPIAFSQDVHSTGQFDPLSITLTGHDPEGAPLSFVLARNPSHGTIDRVPGDPQNVIYFADGDFIGVDSFLFRVSDGAQWSEDAQIYIQVEPLSPNIHVIMENHYSAVQSVSDDENVMVLNYYESPDSIQGKLQCKLSSYDASTFELHDKEYNITFPDSDYTACECLSPTGGHLVGRADVWDDTIRHVKGFIISPHADLNGDRTWFDDTNGDGTNDLFEEINCDESTSVFPQSVNDVPMVVGYYIRSTDDARVAFFWRDGDESVTSLETMSDDTFAISVNNQNFIAGWKELSGSSKGIVWVPDESSGELEFIPVELQGLPGYPNSQPQQITNNCDIVGHVVTQAWQYQAVVWAAPGGCSGLRDLISGVTEVPVHPLEFSAQQTSLPGGVSIQSSFIWSANDIGQVTGIVLTQGDNGNSNFGFVWAGLDGIADGYEGTLVKLTGLQSIAVGFSINNHGIIGGYSRLSVASSATFWDTLGYYGDADMDGLLNGWEMYGDQSDFQFVRHAGAHPLKKDLFVQCEWITSVDADTGSSLSTQLDQAVLDPVMDMFLNAPNRNLDGSSGIQLHLDNGPLSIADPITRSTWGEYSATSGVPVSSAAFEYDFDASYNAILACQEHFYRTYEFRYRPSVARLAISLYYDSKAGGAFPDWFFTAFRGASIVEYHSKVFAHELGHSLGLPHHPDGDEYNYAVNQLSVMNYNYPFGIPRDDGSGFVLDYSRYDSSVIPDFDEEHVSEELGINSAMDLGYNIKWYYSNQAPMNGPADFNKNGEIDTGFVSLFSPSEYLSKRYNYGSRITRSVNEWELIRFKVRNYDWMLFAPDASTLTRRRTEVDELPAPSFIQDRVRGDLGRARKIVRHPSYSESIALLESDFSDIVKVTAPRALAVLPDEDVEVWYEISNWGSVQDTEVRINPSRGSWDLVQTELVATDCDSLEAVNGVCTLKVLVHTPLVLARGDAATLELLVSSATIHIVTRTFLTAVLEAPIADAGPDLAVKTISESDAAAEITLDGSASITSDPSLNLSYIWSGSFLDDVEDSPSPVVNLPIGDHQIQLIVHDSLLFSKPDYMTVKVLPKRCTYRCGKNNAKAEVCRNGQTICIADEAYGNNIKDSCGPCNDESSG